MKIKLLCLAVSILLLGLSASVAMACNCGKKNGESNKSSSCSCGSSCGNGQSVCSESSMTLAQGKTNSGEKTTETKLTEVGNKICPVSGETVGKMGEVVKYEYNGKIYNLCCPMCKKDFSKNSEKYSKIAEDEVKKSK